ncbi:MAG: hypothetical protein BAA01_01190 [Bacillus thermozeamaize]|uniref:Heparan-alpha-glucosaminide N-acetyltransferase catalytic domain-containing protein n=1 Tax=Bacillus thermozeamaize TaxID=230954 RepID=A0A1Y3PIN9_9BACI|nr:MAG: hypothetical protein BAA01_01190 [Bacillus thermozeamaize]
METSQSASSKRIYSVDIARGFVVAFSVLLSHIPPGGYLFFRHAEWYGLTLLDLIFPAFLTLFGVGLGIAYFRRIRWKKVIRRTVILMIIGLLYNAVVHWNADFSTWRITGVLQLYAVSGLVAVLVLSINRTWQFSVLAAAIVMFTYGVWLSLAGKPCAEGVIWPDCNPFAKIDAALFGLSHMYAQGTKGYDPEGLAVMFSALANVFLGAAAGRIIINPQQKKKSRLLFMLGGVLLLTAPLFAFFAPVGKRMWTPAFASLTAGIAVLLLAVLFFLLDDKSLRLKKSPAYTGLYLLEAFGRNSLLIYFGKYLLASVLMHLTIAGKAGTVSVRDKLLDGISLFPGDPKLNYALFFFLFWAALAILLHRQRWYVRV